MSETATRADVCRLFGRAAFGATPADITAWEGQPYEAMVDSLFPPGPPGTVGRLPEVDDAEEAVQDYNTNDPGQAQRWWLERMRVGRYPLEERLTLFWHDHFATAYTGTPDVGTVMGQNRTFRANAFGSFRTLANAITVDAAMLIWLNGISNYVDGVNENYAREFLELFTLGMVPQAHTETDVREAAKAFTGWVANSITHKGEFVPGRHDTSVKTVLGRSIGGHASGSPEEALEYQEVLEAALAHDGGRTTARFIAYKLVLDLGYVPDRTNLDNDPLVSDVAAALRADDKWDLKAAVRTLLLHPDWRDAPRGTGHDLVRSPIEVTVHATKALGFPSPDAYTSLLWPQVVLPVLERAGHMPLVPPNVGGWPNGLNWLTQTTALARYDLLNTLVTYLHNMAWELVEPLPPSGDLDAWATYMGLPGFTTNTKLHLQDYLADPQTADEVQKQIGMFILVGSSPDWQVM